ncbi:MAG: sodium:solute symporter [Flavobacteriales bacterium]|nr:sodium:solute symporter [Flavobacteriales bacterium]|tara:strand:- start:33220 stop:34665 length:1446 start_codon:yes stop_codon:yes gene_type:complete
MSSTLIISVIISYFLILYVISYFTGKNDSNDTFFLGNRKSPWYIIAYGMIGTTLSGITFISVPGWVESNQFSYMQMVFGFFVGYFIISRILLPLYYSLGLTSIYTYLKDRFGNNSYKTGSSFFLLSRTIGASFRLFLIATVLQYAVFDSMGIPFFLTVLITISLIWLYTYRSGMKTIIWTDTLQTTFMLSTVFIIGYTLMDKMNLDISALFSTINDSTYSKVFFFDDMADKKYFFKQFFSGVFMAIVMTGLDQDQMQKNLSCRNLKDAQKNMTVFSVILIFVDLLFLCLGALLYINYYSMLEVNQVLNLPEQADMLFPHIAISSGLPAYVGILFIIGIIAAAYSSADSALTSLTTSFCVDIIEFEKQDAEKQIKTRKYTHLIMSLVLFSVIMIFHAINDQSVVKSLFTVAGYTYGPLLGLFSFGLFTKFQVKDKYVPFICLASPVICYFLNLYISFGFELLIFNGVITFFGLYMISINKSV